MIPQKIQRKTKRLKNVKRAYQIKLLLFDRGLKIGDIARDLKMSCAAVSQSLYGISKISSVDNWLKENLGV